MRSIAIKVIAKPPPASHADDDDHGDRKLSAPSLTCVLLLVYSRVIAQKGGFDADSQVSEETDEAG